jgi:DNA-binding MurR/RpiR family transcriptional regulator
MSFKFSKTFVNAVQATWQEIGSDIEQCAAECEEQVSNEEAIETCIDADRIVMYGGRNGVAAQTEFRSRMAEVGYTVALRDACKSLPYPLT